MATARSEKSASAHLARISKKEVPPQDAQGVLTAAFTAHDYIECIENLRRRQIDPQAYIDGLDKVSSRLPILVEIMLTSRPTSGDKHVGARVRNVLPFPSSAAKDLWHLRDAASFVLRTAGADPGDNR